MTTMRVTMLDNRRSEDGLSVLAANGHYTVSGAFGAWLIQNGWALGVSPPRRAAAGNTIELPAHVADALWWKMDEGAGTTITDEINGRVATVAGTTTHLWDHAGDATFDTDTAFVIRNDAVLDEIMRLDTLDGTLIVGFELQGAAPAASPAGIAWGYGDYGNATDGAYAVQPISTGALAFAYSVKGGAVNQLSASNLTAGTTTGPGVGLIAKTRRFWHTAFHRFGSRLQIDGYESGHHSRSLRMFALEGAGLPSASSSRGLRIGARPINISGNSASYLGAVISVPRLSNWHAIRITGDYRSDVPGWIDNICATMPYGAIPEVFNG